MATCCARTAVTSSPTPPSGITAVKTAPSAAVAFAAVMPAPNWQGWPCSSKSQATIRRRANEPVFLYGPLPDRAHGGVVDSYRDRHCPWDGLEYVATGGTCRPDRIDLHPLSAIGGRVLHGSNRSPGQSIASGVRGWFTSRGRWWRNGMTRAWPLVF